jgi:tetratricopeptide (TPR) repeat protein
MEYPLRTLSTKWEDEDYDELYAAVEFYNQGRYETALNLFQGRPPDPARFFKNLICTFHGPIGWLLMFNTKRAKDRYLRFCIASCLYHLGKYADARDVLGEDQHERAVYLSAWCQHALGRHDEAKALFKRAFYSNPKLLALGCPYEEREVL